MLPHCFHVLEQTCKFVLKCKNLYRIDPWNQNKLDSLEFVFEALLYFRITRGQPFWGHSRVPCALGPSVNKQKSTDQ